MMIAPRVCILTETYYPSVGGGESQTRVLAEGLVANGFGVVVVTRRSEASLKTVERLGKVSVHRLPPVGGGHLKKWGLAVRSLPVLIRLHRQYDILLVSGFRVLGISAVLASRVSRKACILKADSLGEMSGDFFAGGLAKVGWGTRSSLFKTFILLRNRILRKANSWVAISSAVAQELTSHGVDPNAIRTIPNGVDLSRFCPVSREKKCELRRKLGFSERDRIVTYTGRLVAYKGLPLLLTVWEKFRWKHKHVRLLLVGSGGLDIQNCEAELKDYVRGKGLQGSVQFAGEVHNVHLYLQASDLFVFPTQSEAFGISLIEAMACGLPVISTPVGGGEGYSQRQKKRPCRGGRSCPAAL
jgi:glycosyltransferase involved in cell wall biosynthesis